MSLEWRRLFEWEKSQVVELHQGLAIVTVNVDQLMDFYCCICLLLFVYLKCRVESTHWALKRVLQNSLGDLCSAWDAMNNMMTLQHTEIKASFETSTHVVGHIFKVILYKRFLGMVSRYALNQIACCVIGFGMARWCVCCVCFTYMAIDLQVEVDFVYVFARF